MYQAFPRDRQRSRPRGSARHAPAPAKGNTQSPDNRINRAQSQQKIDGPLHMRSLVEVLVEAASSGDTSTSCWRWRAICGRRAHSLSAATMRIYAHCGAGVLHRILRASLHIRTGMISHCGDGPIGRSPEPRSSQEVSRRDRREPRSFIEPPPRLADRRIDVSYRP